MVVGNQRARSRRGCSDVKAAILATTTQCLSSVLAADLIDHLHVALVPILLGRGESLWDGLEGLEERFTLESVSSPSGVAHLTFTRR